MDRGPGEHGARGQSGQQRIVGEGTSHLEWPVSTLRKEIEPDEVHLWAWRLESSAVELPAHIAILDPRELERTYRFHFAADRERYAVAHANLRRILAGYLHQRPEQLRFRTNRFGKPELADEDRTLYFSLSHSQSTAVLAVAQGRPLGVDVEDVRPIEPEVARTHFSVRELSDLSGLEGDSWLSGFYHCWTRKEAILKAEGVGLHRALDGFDVSLLPGQPAELLGSREPFSYLWELHHLTPNTHTIGALATAQPQARLSCFSFLSGHDTTRG